MCNTFLLTASDYEIISILCDSFQGCHHIASSTTTTTTITAGDTSLTFSLTLDEGEGWLGLISTTLFSTFSVLFLKAWIMGRRVRRAVDLLQ